DGQAVDVGRRAGTSSPGRADAAATERRQQYNAVFVHSRHLLTHKQANLEAHAPFLRGVRPVQPVNLGKRCAASRDQVRSTARVNAGRDIRRELGRFCAGSCVRARSDKNSSSRRPFVNRGTHMLNGMVPPSKTFISLPKDGSNG